MTPETRAKNQSTSSTLKDINANSWCNKEVCTLVKAGVISGYNDGYFRPNKKVTRAECSAMIARLFSVSYVGNNKFEDLNGHWAESYMNLLAKLGILNGDANGNANPDDLLTPAEQLPPRQTVLKIPQTRKSPENKIHPHRHMDRQYEKYVSLLPPRSAPNEEKTVPPLL